MNPTYIEAPVTLSRIASGTIPFQLAVERSGDGTVMLYGGTKIDDCQAADWAVAASVAVSVETGAFNTYLLRLTLTANPTGAFIAYKALTATDMSGDAAFGILMKTSVAVAAGDLKAGTDESAPLTITETVDIPAMEADKWYYFNLAFAGVVGVRDAVTVFGLWNASGGNLTQNIDIGWIGRGALAYDIAGFLNADVAVEDDEAVEYNPVLINAVGRISHVPLNTGETCLAEQQLYPVPGTGKLSTTEIVFGVKPITAAEDQSDAGGDVMVVR